MLFHQHNNIRHTELSAIQKSSLRNIQGIFQVMIYVVTLKIEMELFNKH